jgi:hypothetical protein
MYFYIDIRFAEKVSGAYYITISGITAARNVASEAMWELKT